MYNVTMFNLYAFNLGINTTINNQSSINEGLLATITLPESVFEVDTVTVSSVDGSVGLVFSFYENADFFPLPNGAPPDLSIQSPVIGALLGGVPGINNLVHPVVISLQLNNMFDSNDTVSSYVMLFSSLILSL